MLPLIERLNASPHGVTAQALSEAIKRPLPLVSAMLEHLVRSGRVECLDTATDCRVSKSCRQCPDSKGCLAPRYRLRS